MNEDLESILEFSKVRFPRPLGHKEAQELITKIVKWINSEHTRGSYQSSEKCNIYHHSEHGNLVEDKVSTECSGSINTNYASPLSNNLVLASASFTFGRDIHRIPHDTYNHLRFQMIPGYDLEEHNPADLRLMREIKDYIAFWFAEHLEEKSSQLGLPLG